MAIAFGALVKYLDHVSDADISALNIPTGIPLIYHLDQTLNPIEHFYLASAEEVGKAVAEVKNQSVAKS